MIIPKERIVAECSCGDEYLDSQFKALPFVGVMDVGEDRLEIRKCRCGSTVSAWDYEVFVEE